MATHAETGRSAKCRKPSLRAIMQLQLVGLAAPQPTTAKMNRERIGSLQTILANSANAGKSRCGGCPASTGRRVPGKPLTPAKHWTPGAQALDAGCPASFGRRAPGKHWTLGARQALDAGRPASTGRRAPGKHCTPGACRARAL